uniref:Uncharacterized protein n=1 Tax=Aegilops tauschii subsp. strangulata TaxID=200361 RepID=A0A453RKW8_AEGTS
MEKCTKRLQALALIVLLCLATHPQCNAVRYACFKLTTIPACNPDKSICYCCTGSLACYKTRDECKARCVPPPVGLNEAGASSSSSSAFP